MKALTILFAISVLASGIASAWTHGDTSLSWLATAFILFLPTYVCAAIWGQK